MKECLLDIHSHTEPQEDTCQAIFNIPLRQLCLSAASSDTTYSFPYPEGYYSAGIHPWEVAEGDIEPQFLLLHDLASKNRIIAIGEAGLDKLTKATIEEQLPIFKRHIELAEQKQLPLIIHCVRAMDELIRLHKYYRPQVPWIWHGFRGKKQQALQLLAHGIYLSFGEHYNAETLAAIPSNSLFLETDTSTLDIETLLQRAAAIRGASPEELRTILRENIQRVFATPLS